MRLTKTVRTVLLLVLLCLLGPAPVHGASGSYATGPLDDLAVHRVAIDLAKVGIAVHDPVGGTVLVAPSSPVSPVRMTTDQLRAAAGGVWAGAGMSGAALNHLMPAVKLKRTKRVPISAFVAGWAYGSTTRSASLARRMLPSRNPRKHTRMVFPQLVLTLFASDVVRNLPGAKVPPLAQMSQSFATSPCSAMKNFVENAINRVFAAIGQIRVNDAAFERKFGKGFWGKLIRGVAHAGAFAVNTAINAAHQVVLSGVKVAIGAVTNTLAGIAGVVHTIGAVANAVVPWQATVTAAPKATEKLVGRGNPGHFDLGVTAPGSDEDWPAPIKDCAATFGIQLPNLKPKDADVKWDLTAQSPALLVVRKSDSGPLGIDGTARLSYETTPETAEVAKGKERTGLASAVASVHRRDLDELRDRLFRDLFAGLPGFVRDTVGKALQAIVKPILDQALSRVTSIMDVQAATGTVAVTYHEPPEDEKPRKTKKPATKKRPAAGTGALPNPCTLVTTSEAAAAAGQAVLAGRHEPPSADSRYDSCVFASVARQEGPAGQHAVRAGFTLSLIQGKDVAQAREAFAAMRDGTEGATPYAGLADEAFTTRLCAPVQGTCSVNVFLRTGRRLAFLLPISIDADRPAPIALARTVLGRLNR